MGNNRSCECEKICESLCKIYNAEKQKLIQKIQNLAHEITIKNKQINELNKTINAMMSDIKPQCKNVIIECTDSTRLPTQCSNTCVIPNSEYISSLNEKGDCDLSVSSTLYDNPTEQLYEKKLNILERQIFIEEYIKYLINNKNAIINDTESKFGVCIPELACLTSNEVCSILICDNKISP